MCRTQLFRLSLILGVAATTLACANATTSSSAESLRSTEVIVRNSHWRDVNLYVVRGNTRVRIGTARGSATSRLSIPAAYVMGSPDVVLQADPIGDTGHFTFPAIYVKSGDILRLDVANMLTLSMAWTQQRY